MTEQAAPGPVSASGSSRVDKPWGYELRWAITDRYLGKVIHVDAGRKLSLQYHVKKDETVYVLKGRMRFDSHGTLAPGAVPVAGFTICAVPVLPATVKSPTRASRPVPSEPLTTLRKSRLIACAVSGAIARPTACGLLRKITLPSASSADRQLTSA